MQQTIQLNTGESVPVIGLGTWQSEPGKVGAAVEYALESGYRHIDCAPIYGNEKEIGNAFKNVFSRGKIQREEVFVTSKLWNSHHAPEDVLVACRQTLSDLQLEYLDLYLVHWGIATPKELGSEPIDEHGVVIQENVSLQETWRAMEKLMESGLVKAIGVANYTTSMLLDLLSYAKIKPAVNQIELHPYNQQQRLVDFCQYKKIAVTAYSPLGRPGQSQGHGEHGRIVDDPVITEIATVHQKTPAQILLRWGIQHKTIVIPKSVTPASIKSNIEVFDFVLSRDEMDRIALLDKKHRYVDPFEWWRIPYFD